MYYSFSVFIKFFKYKYRFLFRYKKSSFLAQKSDFSRRNFSFFVKITNVKSMIQIEKWIFFKLLS